MLDYYKMEEFVKRCEDGKVDAAEFVDGCNDTIDAYKKLMKLYRMSKAMKLAFYESVVPKVDLNDNNRYTSTNIDLSQEWAGYEVGEIGWAFIREFMDDNGDE